MATRGAPGNREATGTKKKEEKKEEQSQTHAQTQRHAHKQQTSHTKKHEGALQRQTYQLVHRGESDTAAQAAATVAAVTGTANPHTPARKSAGRPPPLRVGGAGGAGRLVPPRYVFKCPLQGGGRPAWGPAVAATAATAAEAVRPRHGAQRRSVKRDGNGKGNGDGDRDGAPDHPPTHPQKSGRRPPPLRVGGAGGARGLGGAERGGAGESNSDGKGEVGGRGKEGRGCAQTNTHRHTRETRYTRRKPAVETHGDVRAQLSRGDGAAKSTERPARNVPQHGAGKAGAGAATSATTATMSEATATAVWERALSAAHHLASSSPSQPTPDHKNGQPSLPIESGARCGGGRRGRAEVGAAVAPVAAGSAMLAGRVLVTDGGRRHPTQCTF